MHICHQTDHVCLCFYFFFFFWKLLKLVLNTPVTHTSTPAFSPFLLFAISKNIWGEGCVRVCVYAVGVVVAYVFAFSSFLLFSCQVWSKRSWSSTNSTHPSLSAAGLKCYAVKLHIQRRLLLFPQLFWFSLWILRKSCLYCFLCILNKLTKVFKYLVVL